MHVLLKLKDFQKVDMEMGAAVPAGISPNLSKCCDGWWWGSVEPTHAVSAVVLIGISKVPIFRLASAPAFLLRHQDVSTRKRAVQMWDFGRCDSLREISGTWGSFFEKASKRGVQVNSP